MKTLYLDLFSGISGDMFIGALIDLGVDARKLERELKKLKLGGWHLHVARQQKSGIAGIKFDVHVDEGQATGTGTADHAAPASRSPSRRQPQFRRNQTAHLAQPAFKLGEEKIRGRVPAHRRSRGQNSRPAAGARSFPRSRRGGFHRGHRGRVRRAGNARQTARARVAGRRRHRLD